MLTDETKFVIVAGRPLVEKMVQEIAQRCASNPRGYSSEDLCAVQREHAARGYQGAEIVFSNYGCSVRYDSGLQDFGLLASARHKQVDGTLEDAIRWVKVWCAKDPERRYAWHRFVD